MGKQNAPAPEPHFKVTIQYEDHVLTIINANTERNYEISDENQILTICRQHLANCIDIPNTARQSEILKEYQYLQTHDELIPHPMFGPEGDRIWKNEKRRNQLEKEYKQTLPKEQQIAILLYETTYHPYENWDDEKDGLIHNWDGPIHQLYLQKAERFTAIP